VTTGWKGEENSRDIKRREIGDTGQMRKKKDVKDHSEMLGLGESNEQGFHSWKHGSQTKIWSDAQGRNSYVGCLSFLCHTSFQLMMAASV
jgi:hypothetical protein